MPEKFPQLGDEEEPINTKLSDLEGRDDAEVIKSGVEQDERLDMEKGSSESGVESREGFGRRLMSAARGMIEKREPTMEELQGKISVAEGIEKHLKSSLVDSAKETVARLFDDGHEVARQSDKTKAIFTAGGLLALFTVSSLTKMKANKKLNEMK